MQIVEKLPEKMKKGYIKFVLDLFKEGKTGWEKRPSKEQIINFMKSAALNHFLIEDKSIIGHAGFHKIDYSKAAILFIAVRKDKRGKGVGKRLLKYTIFKAKEKGIEKLIAFVKKKNKAGKKLFSSCNFSLLHEMNKVQIYGLDIN